MDGETTSEDNKRYVPYIYIYRYSGFKFIKVAEGCQIVVLRTSRPRSGILFIVERWYRFWLKMPTGYGSLQTNSMGRKLYGVMHKLWVMRCMGQGGLECA